MKLLISPASQFLIILAYIETAAPPSHFLVSNISHEVTGPCGGGKKWRATRTLRVCTFCQRKAARRPGCIHICMQMHIHKVSKAKLPRGTYINHHKGIQDPCTAEAWQNHQGIQDPCDPILQSDCNSRPYRINHIN